jgi:hypothetical protein
MGDLAICPVPSVLRPHACVTPTVTEVKVPAIGACLSQSQQAMVPSTLRPQEPFHSMLSEVKTGESMSDGTPM